MKITFILALLLASSSVLGGQPHPYVEGQVLAVNENVFRWEFVTGADKASVTAVASNLGHAFQYVQAQVNQYGNAGMFKDLEPVVVSVEWKGKTFSVPLVVHVLHEVRADLRMSRGPDQGRELPRGNGDHPAQPEFNRGPGAALPRGPDAEKEIPRGPYR